MYQKKACVTLTVMTDWQVESSGSSLSSSSFKSTIFYANSFQNWQIKNLNNGLQCSPLAFYFVTNVSFVQVNIFSSNLFYDHLHKQNLGLCLDCVSSSLLASSFFLGSRRGRFRSFK